MVSVIDGHLHVVSADTDRYPLQPGGLGRDWWTGRTVDVGQISRDLAAAGVDRGVIVQAVGPYRSDNRYARAAVLSDPDRFALVGAIDASGPDPGGELAALVGDGGVAGARVFAVGGDASWLTDSRGEAIWEVAARTGVSLVAALFADHLDALGALVSGRPDVVEMRSTTWPSRTSHRRPAYPQAGPLFALAALPAVHLKLTTIGLLGARGAGGSRALVDRLIAGFGRTGSRGDRTTRVVRGPYPDMVQLALARVRRARPRGAAVLGRDRRSLVVRGPLSGRSCRSRTGPR
jgi:predicted TIM-barrel fold metal-dependent hydrolase